MGVFTLNLVLNSSQDNSPISRVRIGRFGGSKQYIFPTIYIKSDVFFGQCWHHSIARHLNVHGGECKRFE